MAERKRAKPIRRTTKGKGANYRPTKSGAGMTKKGVREYRKKNPGSNLKTAVTGKVKKGSKDANRRKSYCTYFSFAFYFSHLTFPSSSCLTYS